MEQPGQLDKTVELLQTEPSELHQEFYQPEEPVVAEAAVAEVDQEPVEVFISISVNLDF